MEKTISMIINDTKTSLISTINNSGLPISIMELIVKDIYQEIKTYADNQLKYDEEQYKNALNEKEVNNDKNDEPSK